MGRSQDQLDKLADMTLYEISKGINAFYDKLDDLQGERETLTVEEMAEKIVGLMRDMEKDLGAN